MTSDEWQTTKNNEKQNRNLTPKPKRETSEPLSPQNNTLLLPITSQTLMHIFNYICSIDLPVYIAIHLSFTLKNGGLCFISNWQARLLCFKSFLWICDARMWLACLWKRKTDWYFHRRLTKTRFSILCALQTRDVLKLSTHGDVESSFRWSVTRFFGF